MVTLLSAIRVDQTVRHIASDIEIPRVSKIFINYLKIWLDLNISEFLGSFSRSFLLPYFPYLDPLTHEPQVLLRRSQRVGIGREQAAAAP